MTYRIIPTEAHSAAMNMALDGACMESVRAGESPATIRLYRWEPSAVSIGYFQCLTDEVDLEQAEALDVELVRRQTGGGAVYHDSEGEITYSVIAPEKDFSADIEESYEEIIRCVINGLAHAGITAEYRPINDVIVDGQKISGNAQTRKGGVLQQHGTILYTVDPERMFRLLTPDKAKNSDKPYVKSVKSAVTSVSQLSDATRSEVEAALRRAFTDAFDATPGSWSEEERARAQELAKHKYGDESWVAMR